MKRLDVYIHFIVQGEAIEELSDMREGQVVSIGALETLLEESASATVTKIEETGVPNCQLSHALIYVERLTYEGEIRRLEAVVRELNRKMDAMKKIEEKS